MNRYPHPSVRTPAALLGAAAVLLLTSCSPELAEEAPVLRPVRTLQVYASGGERERSFSGTAQAGQESRLSFKVSGTIQEVPVSVGDRVEAGDRIARLDPTDYNIQLQDYQASLDRFSAESRQAQANYDRTRQLYENKNASRADLDAARAAAEAAKAAVESADRKVALARTNLRYTDLLAPQDGAISQVQAEVNENVSPGQVIAVLSSGTRTEVLSPVPEALITGVREGDAVTVTFDAAAGRTFAATVTEVGVTASPGGATFPVTVRLDDEAASVRPGMAANVTFRFGNTGGPDRIRIPASAVLEDRAGRFAFVVRPAGDGTATVSRRAISVGDLGADGLEVLDGLADGDLVVTAGVTKIQDGMTVKMPEGAGS